MSSKVVSKAIASPWLSTWLDTAVGRLLVGLLAILSIARVVSVLSTAIPERVDFAVFHAAAELFAAGETMLLFDNEAFADVHGLDDDMRWLYPPQMLFFIWPLRLMPIGTAYVLQCLVGWGAFAASGLWLLRRVAPRSPPVLGLTIVAMPGVAWPMVMGHPSLFWFGGLTAALALRDGGRSGASGVVVGLLAYKPTLGVLVAVALIAARDWRAVGAAAATVALLAGAATAVVGVDYWAALLAKMLEHAGEASSIEGYHRQVGVQALIVYYGGSSSLGALAHGLVALVCFITVAVLWFSARSDFGVRAALLLALAPMFAPATWFYDSIGLSASAVILAAAGAVPTGVSGVAVVFLLYLNVYLPFLGQMPGGVACLPATLGALWIGMARPSASSNLEGDEHLDQQVHLTTDPPIGRLVGRAPGPPLHNQAP